MSSGDTVGTCRSNLQVAGQFWTHTSIINRLDMHVSDHCSACDRLQFVRPRATSQRIVRIVCRRNLTSCQLTPREIQVATIAALSIQKLWDNDNPRLSILWVMLVSAGLPLMAPLSVYATLCCNGGSRCFRQHVPTHCLHYSHNCSTFEHFWMNLTKGYLGDGTPKNLPQLRNVLITDFGKLFCER